MHFYTSFVTALEKLAQGQARVCVVSHAGHTSRPLDASGYIYDLEMQIQHKLRFLQQARVVFDQG